MTKALEDLRIFLKKKFEDRAISQNALAPETFDRSTSPLHPEGLFLSFLMIFVLTHYV